MTSRASEPEGIRMTRTATSFRAGLLGAGLSVAAFSPYVWFPYGSDRPYDVPRFVALMVAAALVGFGLARAPVGGSEGLHRAWGRALLGGSIAAALSAILGVMPSQSLTYGAELSWMGLPVWLSLAGISFVASRPHAQSGWRRVAGILVAGAAASAVLGVADRLGGGSAASIFGNGNYLGTVTVSCIPLALLLAHASGGWVRTLWTAALAALVAGTVASVSATAIAVLLGQAIVLAVGTPRLLGICGSRQTRAVRIAGLVVAGMTALIGVLWVAAPDALPASVRTTLDAEITGGSAQTRVARWEVALRVFQRYPLLGVGPDALDVASQPIMTERYIGGGEGVTDGVVMLLRDPHALPLLIADSFGALGLVAAIAIALAWTMTVKRGLAALNGDRRDALLLMALSTTSFFACLLLVPWTIRFAALPALVAGVSVGMAMHEGRTPSGGARIPVRLRPSRLLAATVAVTACVLGVSAAAGEHASVTAGASRSPEEAREAAGRAARVQPTRAAAWQRTIDVTGELMLAGMASPDDFVAAYDRAPAMLHAYGPHEVSTARIALDHVLINGGTRAMALWAADVADAALERAPRLPEVQVEAARAALVRGDTARAAALLDSAERLGYPMPRIELYRFYLAQVEGDEPTARQWAEAVAARPETGLELLLVDFPVEGR